MPKFKSQGNLSKGHVRVACLASVAIGLLSPAIEAFEKENPGLRVSIRDDTGSGVEKRVLERAADFGIAGGPIRSPTLAFTPLFDEPYFLALPCRSPAGQEKEGNLGRGVRIRLHRAWARDQYRSTTDVCLWKRRATFQTSCTSFHSLVQFGDWWERGLGVSALPRVGVPGTWTHKSCRIGQTESDAKSWHSDTERPVFDTGGSGILPCALYAWFLIVRLKSGAQE